MSGEQSYGPAVPPDCLPPGPDSEYNRQRWDALVRANSVFNRPYLDLDSTLARQLIDPAGLLGPVAEKSVLCLASGGGRQSVAFALLGAHVTVLDLSRAVLERDREAAAHHDLVITLEAGDMRDLSRFPPEAFDIVWQPYSINLVPDIQTVFREVAHVLRPNGLYHLQVANPFTLGLGTYDWTGDGYALRLPYLDGQRIDYPDETWVYQAERDENPIPPPREYRHTLSTIVNGLINHGFQIERVDDYEGSDVDAEPATWSHFTSIAPPWFDIWSTRSLE